MEAKNAQPNFTRGHLLAQEKSQMYTSRVEKEVRFGMEIPFNCSLHFDCQSVNEAGKKIQVGMFGRSEVAGCFEN